MVNRLDWLRDGETLDWPRVLLAVLACTLVIAIGVFASTSAVAFGPFNPSWDGTVDFRQGIDDEPGVDADLVRGTEHYETVDPEGTVAFVVAPEGSYEGADARRVRRFVENGGTLVVLEDFGTGNELLASVGARARTDGRVVQDEHHHDRGPAMPVATRVEDHPYTAGVDRLTLNYATVIDPDDATVLVRTSSFAYVDVGEEGLDGEELGARPVATVERVGDGEVVVVSDPSIAINAMHGEPDNAAFLRALYADADRVLVDRSHAGELPPLVAATLTVRETPALRALLGALGIGAIALLSRRRAGSIPDRIRARAPERFLRRLPAWLWRVDVATPPMDDAARAAHLRRRHPDWDERRVQRVIAGLNRTDRQRREDDHE